MRRAAKELGSAPNTDRRLSEDLTCDLYDVRERLADIASDLTLLAFGPAKPKRKEAD